MTGHGGRLIDTGPFCAIWKQARSSTYYLIGRQQPWPHGYKTPPGREIVSRGRASAYTEATRRAAPQAVQIADRWHLMRNMSEAVCGTCCCLRRRVAASIRCGYPMRLREPAPSSVVLIPEKKGVRRRTAGWSN